jgi:copper chaperone
MTEITYTVPAMHCGNCTAAVEREISRLDGVTGVVANLETKQVVVLGDDLDDGAIRAAIDEAGYEAA